MALTITLDLEDSSGRNAPGGRWITAAERFLDALLEKGYRSTVFIVGEAARACPQLVSRVHADGHEVALHGLRHVPLAQSGSTNLASELRTGKAMLEEITGSVVRGFRAPIFSLTPETAWAVDQLTDAGFAYSSSILPAKNPLHGWPGLPNVPFAWSTGLVELPCPVLGVGPLLVPYLGGIYLRYVPLNATRRRLANLPPEAAPWSYVHPYDVDVQAPFERFPHANWPTSLLLHTRRRATLPRLLKVVAAAGGPGPRMGDVVDALDLSALQQVAAFA